jgi:chromosomal replication initiator protein
LWLAPLEALDWDGRVLRIRVPDTTYQWVSRRFGRLVERESRRVLGGELRVEFVTGQRNRSPGSRREPPTAGEQTFNPRYSFDQFVIGESNRLAHAAALAVAEMPGQAYNPLFLFASPGLGKTHLLHAIGNYVLAFGGGATVRYTTAEAFTNHFLAALTTRSIERFKQLYRTVDVLLIDDVQFLASKARTEEEFFHTFNAVYEAGRQLVVTCDRLPKDLTAVEERLRERFEAGLVAEIRRPDFHTRRTILRKRTTLDGIKLADPTVLDLIAERVTSNVRALEGALIRIVASNSLTPKPIDRDFAAGVLDAIQPRPPARTPSTEEVQKAVAARYGVAMGELLSASRSARLAWPRQIAMYLARELTRQPLERIGADFGGRNHTTVVHACAQVARRLANDQRVQTELQSVRDAIDTAQRDRGC